MPSLSSLTFLTLALLIGANASLSEQKQAKLVGGKTSLTEHDLTEDPNILKIADSVARHFDEKSIHRQTVFTSPHITSGTKQVVAGMKYDLQVQLFKTLCLQTGDLPSVVNPCPPIIGNTPFCTVTASVWSRPWIGAPQVTISAETCASL